MEAWKFWWGVGAFFLGGLATQLNGWLVYRRQRAEKAADDATAAEQRRAEFELQHLIATNQKLHDYRLRFHNFTGAVRRAREARADGRPQGDELGIANEALEAAEGSLHGHVGFILDDSVRGSVIRAIGAVEDAISDVLDQNEVGYIEVNTTVNAAFDAVSERARKLYAGQGES